MKILILHGHLSMGGEEKVLMNILKNFENLGYDVDLLITWNYKKNNLFENEIPKKINYEFVFDSYDGKNKIIKEIYRINARKKYPKIVKNKIKKEKYDLVIDYSSNLLKYENFFSDVPIIAWVHFSLTFGQELKNKRIEKYKKQYSKYFKIVTICESMKKEFIEKLEFNEEKIEMIYNPVDIKFLEKQAEKINLKIEKFLKEDYFLYVSRLTDQKQPEQVVDIYYKLKQQGIKKKLYIIGNGDKIELIKQKINEYNLKDDVTLLGQVENPYPFFKNAKLFIHTSKYEGLGMVLVESMVFGIPVVAYDCPTGPKDILGDSEYGELVTLNNKNLFVEKVCNLINDDKKYEQYKKKSRVRADKFSIEINRLKLKELVENLNI